LRIIIRISKPQFYSDKKSSRQQVFLFVCLFVTKRKIKELHPACLAKVLSYYINFPTERKEF